MTTTKDKPQIAVIIPFVGEYPHLHYTLQSVYAELDSHNCPPFEVLVIDNACAEAGGLVKPEVLNNKATLLHMTDQFRKTPWLRYLTFNEKLSHWACKNYAIRQTEAPFLVFLDAHCVFSPGALGMMVKHYIGHSADLNGSLHLRVSDFFEKATKRYALLFEPQHGILHYKNVPDTSQLVTNATPVPIASTCGMICRREHIVHDLGYWPDELGPYGGGEGYFNFVMAMRGRRKWQWDSGIVYHWHLKSGQWSRDYQISYSSWMRNILIATYLVAGEQFTERLIVGGHRNGPHPFSMVSRSELRGVYDEILSTDSLVKRREMVRDGAVVDLMAWAKAGGLEKKKRGDCGQA